MMKKIAVLFSCMFAFIRSVKGADDLFPHEAANGDTNLELSDALTEHVHLQDSYWLYEHPFNDVRIGADGYVSDNTGYVPMLPHPMSEATIGWPAIIAPLYSDIVVYNIWFDNIWYRETQDQAMLDKAKDAIQPHFQDCGGPQFDPTSVLIVTWQRVISFCATHPDYMYGYYYDPDYRHQPIDLERREFPQQPDTSATEETRAHAQEIEHSDDRQVFGDTYFTPFPVNYFQLVLATDGEMTFALFNTEAIQWRRCFGPNTSGFADGEGKRSYDRRENGYRTDSWNIYRVDSCYILSPECSVCNN